MKLSEEQFLDRYDVDLRYIRGPDYIGPQLAGESGALDIDIWGVPRTQVEIQERDESGEFSESYKEVVRSPLREVNSIEEILGYDHWPSADWFDYSTIEQQCLNIRDAGRVVVFMGDRLNRLAQLKPACYLRGFEHVCVDMAEHPELARALFRKISEFYLEYGHRILEAGKGNIDILYTGDDFGSQDAPLISLSMWREFLKPGFEEFFKLGKHHGSYIMHHTCGSVSELIPDIIECKLDILQSLQPEAAKMDPQDLKREFGDRLCFHGGISIQKILPLGSGEEVRRHVKTVLEAMSPGGGYIAGTSHNIQVDTPLDNLLALFESYREFGRYGS
jgi:uroporphyrinogen decarboxylase